MISCLETGRICEGAHMWSTGELSNKYWSFWVDLGADMLGENRDRKQGIKVKYDT
jgi:hypothetical protein